MNTLQDINQYIKNISVFKEENECPDTGSFFANSANWTMNISLHYKSSKTCTWRVYNTVPNTKLRIVINNFKVISKSYHLIIHYRLKIYIYHRFPETTT